MQGKQPRSKPQRFVRVLHRDPDGIVMRLTFKTPRTVKEQLYHVLPIPGCTFGQGFEVKKDDGTVYHVSLNSHESTCDCRGFGKWGYCKHVEALATLAQACQLSPLDIPTDAELELQEPRRNFHRDLLPPVEQDVF